MAWRSWARPCPLRQCSSKTRFQIKCSANWPRSTPLIGWVLCRIDNMLYGANPCDQTAEERSVHRVQARQSRGVERRGLDTRGVAVLQRVLHSELQTLRRAHQTLLQESIAHCIGRGHERQVQRRRGQVQEQERQALQVEQKEWQQTYWEQSI